METKLTAEIVEALTNGPGEWRISTRIQFT